MAHPCPVCELEFDEDACPRCPTWVHEAYAHMCQEGGFAAAAWPENGLALSDRLRALRLALLQSGWQEAEAEWLKVIRGLVGHDPAAREKQARAFESYASLMEGLGRDKEGGMMRARASRLRCAVETMKKPERREMTYSFMKEIRAEEGVDPSRAAEALRRVEEREAKSERLGHAAKWAGWTLAGLLGFPIFGLSALTGGALGLVAGGAVEARHLLKR